MDSKFKGWQIVTPSDYRAALARLNLSQRKAASFFGKDERTSRMWADRRGHGPPTEAAMWLRFMIATNISPAEVMEILAQDAETQSSG